MTTIRDNDIYFSVPVGYQLVKGTFKVIDGSVTTDQPSNVKAGSVLSCGADGKFRFSVGRKASSTVANWFNRQIDTNFKTTFGHTASELNFAFTGHLSN